MKSSRSISPDGPARDVAENRCETSDSSEYLLAAFFHWNDRQGLNQAVAVARAHSVNVAEVKASVGARRNEEEISGFLGRVEQQVTVKILRDRDLDPLGSPLR